MSPPVFLLRRLVGMGVLAATLMHCRQTSEGKVAPTGTHPAHDGSIHCMDPWNRDEVPVCDGVVVPVVGVIHDSEAKGGQLRIDFTMIDGHAMAVSLEFHHQTLKAGAEVTRGFFTHSAGGIPEGSHSDGQVPQGRRFGYRLVFHACPASGECWSSW
jgi:hypothetical protein